MQYTGLADKNGLDIYEGDIARRFYSDGHIDGIVRWSVRDSGFFTQGIGDGVQDYPLCFNIFFANSCEVIGNIHQNPELLNGKQ